MADAPFDRTVLHNLEKPLSGDFNQLQSQLDRALRFALKSMFSATTGFIKEGFQVVEDSPPAMSVLVTKGSGFVEDPSDVPTDISGVDGLDDLESYKPLVLTADETFTVPTAPTAPNSRIDIIEVRVDRKEQDNISRQILDPNTGQFNATAVDKILSFLTDGLTGQVSAPSDSTEPLSYKVGVAANPGVAPATTTGYVKLCEIAVGSDVVVINNGDITDVRTEIAFTSTAVDSDITQLQADVSGKVDKAGDTMTGGLGIDPSTELSTNPLGIIPTIAQTRGLLVTDSVESVGFGLNRYGLPVGPFVDFTEHFRESAAVGWDFTATGAASFNYTTSGGAKSIVLTNAADSAYMRTTRVHIPLLVDSVFVLELLVALPLAGNGDTSRVHIGLTSDAAGIPTDFDQFIGFRYDDFNGSDPINSLPANNRIYGLMRDGGGSDFGSSHLNAFPPISSIDLTAYNMYRIEYRGANQGAGAEVRLFINNNLAATKTSNISSAAKGLVVAADASTAVGGAIASIAFCRYFGSGVASPNAIPIAR